MPPPHFDLVDLRLMVRIAEADSLTKGAEGAHMSAPAASTRIKNIEESLGLKLLHRTPQGVTLTPPGQTFVHHARLVLGQLNQLRNDLQEYARGIRGHLRVQANTLTELREWALDAYARSGAHLQAIRAAQKLLWDRLRIAAEPGGATALFDCGVNLERRNLLEIVGTAGRLYLDNPFSLLEEDSVIEEHHFGQDAVFH